MVPPAVLTGRLRRAIRGNLTRVRRQPEVGYSTETVIWTAVLALLAIATAAIIYGKVLAKARGIHLQ